MPTQHESADKIVFIYPRLLWDRWRRVDDPWSVPWSYCILFLFNHIKQLQWSEFELVSILWRKKLPNIKTHWNQSPLYSDTCSIKHDGNDYFKLNEYTAAWTHIWIKNDGRKQNTNYVPPDKIHISRLIALEK